MELFLADLSELYTYVNIFQLFMLGLFWVYHRCVLGLFHITHLITIVH